MLVVYKSTVVQLLSHVHPFATPWAAACLPCPSLSPRVCSNSCPLRQWCHPTISSYIAPFSPCPQSFPASGYCQWVSSLHQVAKVLELQLHHLFFQWIFRVDFLYDWLVWSPCCPRDSQESSPAHNSKASIIGAQSSLRSNFNIGQHKVINYKMMYVLLWPNLFFSFLTSSRAWPGLW